MPTPSELSIIILHFETPALLAACLERLNTFMPGVQKLIIDTSEDRSKAAYVSGEPHTSILRVPNFSMAYAINEGLKQVKTPLIAHMNADVLVEADSFSQLLESFDPPDIAMVGPRFKDAQGRWQQQGLLYRGYYERLERSRQAAISVPWLSGALQILKREALLKVGGMNPNFRFYNEDTEWCWRFRRAGYRCLLHSATVTHLGGSATPDDAKFIIEGYRGGLLLSEWTKPRWYRQLHRFVLRGLCAWNIALGSASERETYRWVRSLLERDLLISPFGTSLSEANLAFFSSPHKVPY